jgi:hypothetical protein
MSKSKALKIAAKYGFVLDESISGKIGDCFMITFDHPTHSLSGDCRSIHIEDYGNGDKSAAKCAWEEAVERLESEGQHLILCEDPDCDYHNE